MEVCLFTSLIFCSTIIFSLRFLEQKRLLSVRTNFCVLTYIDSYRAVHELGQSLLFYGGKKILEPIFTTALPSPQLPLKITLASNVVKCDS